MKTIKLVILFGLSIQLINSQPLSIDESGHFFTTTNGDPFFWLGDTGWELFHRLDRDEVTHYFKTRADQGFNVIQAVVLYELQAFESPNAYGDYPLLNEDISKLNITKGDSPDNPAEYDYWDHVKYVMDQAVKYNLIIGLLPCWGEYVTPRFRDRTIKTEELGYNYGHFIGEWLREYNDHIVWILGGDRLPDEQPNGVEIWRAMAEGITDAVKNSNEHDGQSDYSKTFMTFHCYPTSSRWFANDEWIDMHTWGSYHAEKDFERAFYEAWNQWEREPVKPFINSEPAYENHPVGYDSEHAAKGRFDDFDMRQIAYWSVFGGASGHTYGANEVWQMYKKENPHLPLTKLNTREWNEALDYKGAQQMIHLKKLLLKYDYFSRVPYNEILAKNPHDPPGRLVATKGENYILVYIPTGKPVFLYSNQINTVQSVFKWYNPKDGTSAPAEYLQEADLLLFDPPGENKRGNDWVLIIEND